MIRLLPPKPEDELIFLEMMEDFYRIDDYPFDWDISTSNFRRFLLPDPPGHLWMVMDHKSLIGYLVVIPGFSFYYGGTDAWVDEFYLRPEFRSKGLGKKVFEVLMEKARELKWAALHLEVEKHNARAKRLYDQFGFVDNETFYLTRDLRKG